MLDVAPLWLLLAITVGLFLLAVEGGYRAGILRARRSEQGPPAPIDSMAGVILGLLAFMLAFTFGLAMARQDTRKKLVLDEAIAISAADLRSRSLPEPHRSEMRGLLREYVDVRVKGVQEPSQVRQAIERSGQLQEQLWSRAASLEKEVSGLVLGPLLASLTQISELHTRRIAAGLQDRIPGSIWVALYSLALIGMGMTGYGAGITGRRSKLAALALVVAFSAVIVLVVDLDRPVKVLTKVSQQPMLDLQSKLRLETS
jgi:hypothetical protein